MTMWHNKMFAKTIYQSQFPFSIMYVDKHSVGKNSYNDLDISFINRVVGSNRELSVGDGIIVIAKNDGSEDYKIFSAVVLSETKDKGYWKKGGGKEWPKCYSISILSNKLQEKKSITQTWKWGKKNNNAHHRSVEAVFNYCTRMHPLFN